MATINETTVRNNLTVSAMDKLIATLTAAGYTISRTKDFQTLTFEVGEVKTSDKDYTAFGSVKFTLHKEDFDLADAELEYEEKVKAKADKEAEKAKKAEAAVKKKAEAEAKKKNK